MKPQFIDVEGADGWQRKIAYLATPGSGGGSPGVVWLSGLKSDMASTKASVLADWAQSRGVQMTRFDFSGHGDSGGDFTEGTISRWLEESLAVLEGIAPGPQILVGSSMGGWIALLVLRHFATAGPATPIRGAVLIAPAWDMTEALMWREFSDEARRAIAEEGVYHRPSDYGEPYAITRHLIEDGRAHLIENSPFAPGCPVRIIQGVRDEDVPLAHATALQDLLVSDDVALQLVEDGEHRLSRPQDLDLLLGAVDELLTKAQREVSSANSALNPSR